MGRGLGRFLGVEYFTGRGGHGLGRLEGLVGLKGLKGLRGLKMGS